MSIKSLRTLGRNERQVSKITLQEFRSPKELFQFLEGLSDSVNILRKKVDNYTRAFEKAAIKITIGDDGNTTTRKEGKVIDPTRIGKLVVPNTKGLKDNFNVVQELHEKLEILQSIESTFSYNFKDAKGRAEIEKKMKILHTTTKATYEKALNFLADVAKKYSPPKFNQTIKPVIEDLKTSLQGFYDKVSEKAYVTIVENEGKDVFYFSKYIKFNNLRNDNDFAYTEYYVIFTAIIDGQGFLQMYVNTLPKFEPPGKRLIPGHQFNDTKSAQQEVDSLLAIEHFLGVLDRLPFPIDEKPQLKKLGAKDFIKNIDFDPESNTIHVDFNAKVNKKNLENVVLTIYKDLQGLLTPKTQGKLKHKTPYLQGKLYATDFILQRASGSTSPKIDSNGIKMLKVRLGLDDDDISNIVRVLNKGV